MSKKEILGSEWDDIRSLLFQARKVSEAHFKRHGSKWTLWEQLNHVHSEVSELYEGLRRNKGDGNVLEEIWDVFFSVITVGHLMEFTDEELLQGMVTTLRKIQERVKEAAL